MHQGPLSGGSEVGRRGGRVSNLFPNPTHSDRTCPLWASGSPAGFNARLAKGCPNVRDAAATRSADQRSRRPPERACPAKTPCGTFFRFALCLAIHLFLMRSDLARCRQAHHQSPHPGFLESAAEVRALPSTGINRLQRYYDRLRLPAELPSLQRT